MEHEPTFGGLLKDHRQGLADARRLQRAVSDGEVDPASAARSFLVFWQREASIHFRKEEDVLLPVLARYGGDLWEEPVARLLTNHTRIKGLVMELGDEVLRAETRPGTLRRLGEQLEVHVRLAEREVFPLIEETLPPHALEEAGGRLAVFEAGSRAEPWVPAEGLSFDPWPGPGDSEGGGFD